MRIQALLLAAGILLAEDAEGFFCLTPYFDIPLIGERCFCRGGELRCFKQNSNGYRPSFAPPGYGLPGYGPPSYGPPGYGPPGYGPPGFGPDPFGLSYPPPYY